MSRYEPPEPCMCGADDCRLCRPTNYREAEFDEDAEKPDCSGDDGYDLSD